jgi:hypothetical protein
MIPVIGVSIYKDKLKGRIYGLLCEYENKGQWEKFLDTISIELLALEGNFDEKKYWALYGKLSALKFLSYPYFRKVIFECLNLVGDLDG